MHGFLRIIGRGFSHANPERMEGYGISIENRAHSAVSVCRGDQLRPARTALARTHALDDAAARRRLLSVHRNHPPQGFLTPAAQPAVRVDRHRAGISDGLRGEPAAALGGMGLFRKPLPAAGAGLRAVQLFVASAKDVFRRSVCGRAFRCSPRCAPETTERPPAVRAPA